MGAWKSERAEDCSYEVYEKEHYIKQEFWGGYTRHNKIHRRKYSLQDVEIADEFVAENHAIMMYEPLLTQNI